MIQVSGDYIPRKATRLGFKTRHLPAPGVGRRSFGRSTLGPRTFYWSSLRRQDEFGDVNLGNWDGGVLREREADVLQAQIVETDLNMLADVIPQIIEPKNECI